MIPGRLGDWCQSLPDDIVAGAFAGFVARMLTAPFDVLKIRYQLNERNIAQSANMIGAMRIIVREEGLAALWKGNVPALYLWVSYTVVQFACYGWLKKTMQERERDISQVTIGKETKQQQRTNQARSPSRRAFSNFVAGAMASTIATISTYPFDIMRTQFALQTSTTNGFTSMNTFASHMLRRKGLTGLYGGLGPAVLSITPYMGLNFALYESFQTILSDNSDAKEGGVMRNLKKGVLGGIAGGASKFFVYPLDTVKKRLQASTLRGGGMAASSTLLGCVRNVYAVEGVGGFYRGLVPTTAKAVASTAIIFAAFEVRALIAVVHR
jgi:solute carrier family 25 thiamine pyrophosphate transporter 19